MKMFHVALVAAAISLGGCVSAQFDRIGALFEGFEGRPLKEMTARMGPPTGEAALEGEHWYTWRYSDFMSGIGQMQCEVHARVEAGVVAKIKWNGNLGGCRALASRA
jgi:hypothetical protein